MERQPLNKERLAFGFEGFLRRHLKPGEPEPFAQWQIAARKDVLTRLPMDQAGSFSEGQLREVFEVIGHSYGFMTSIADQRTILSALIDFGIDKGRTLSVGCGLAPHEIYLASQGLIGEEIVGIDTAKSVLERAEAIAKKEGLVTTKFIQNYGADIDYSDEFSQAFLIDSLHWMRRWKECLIKTVRALKSDGTLSIVYSPHSPAVSINPMEIIKVLSEQKMNVTILAEMASEVATPRIIIAARKESSSTNGLIVPTIRK